MELTTSENDDNVAFERGGVDAGIDFVKLGLEEAPVAVLVINDRGQIELANRAACATFGYSAAEFHELALATLFPAEIHDIHGHWVRQCLAKLDGAGISLAHTNRGRRRDGFTFNCEVRLNLVICDEHTWVVATVAQSFHEETATDDLATDLGRWRGVLEQLGEHFWVWNLSTDEVDLSEMWLSAMGYSASDISNGEKWFELVHPNKHRKSRRQLRSMLSWRDGAIRR